ncbi:putative Metal-dependent hydrolase [Gammaproteobacteria bacterium]
MQKIMSFNIRVPVEWDKENQWKYRKNLVSEIINDYSDGIAGLQEVKPQQFFDLDELLAKNYQHIGEQRDSGYLAECNPIYYDEEKYIVLSHGQQWISETPEVMSRLNGADYNRIVVWGEFERKVDKKIFYLFNVHYDYTTPVVIEKSSEIVINIIAKVAIKKDLPVFLIGDFNCNEQSNGYKKLLEKYKNAKYLARKTRGPAKTFTNWGWGFENPDTIDHIFVKNIKKVEFFEVLDLFIDGKYPSDHFPVVCDVEF